MQVKDQDSQGQQASHHLLLHIFILHFYAYALVTKMQFYSCGGVACGTPTLLRITTPVGAAIRIAPRIIELAERVLNTLLPLWKTLSENPSKHYGGRRRKEEKCLTNYFEKMISEKPRNGNTLTGCLEKGKVFERSFAGSKWRRKNVFKNFGDCIWLIKLDKSATTLP